MFGALLGDKEHGRWLLAPADPAATRTRSYEADTFILSTVWKTGTGSVEVVDFMPHSEDRADVLRRVHGVNGSVEMTEDLRIRFGYATTMPWVRQARTDDDHGLVAAAGPDAIIVRGPELHAADHRHVATFSVAAGQDVDLQLTVPWRATAPGRFGWETAPSTSSSPT